MKRNKGAAGRNKRQCGEIFRKNSRSRGNRGCKKQPVGSELSFMCEYPHTDHREEKDEQKALCFERIRIIRRSVRIVIYVMIYCLGYQKHGKEEVS